MDDREIIDLYWARSESAILATAEKYGSYCRAIAFRILHSDQDSEECVNDTWLKAWNAMPPQRPAVLSTFLGRLTRNLALNRWKAYSAEKRGGGEMVVALEELGECVSASGGVESALEGIALTEILDRFVGALPKEQRKIFVQRYWYLCSVREIADNCVISSSKVKVTLFRTRRALREVLRKEGVTV